MDLTQSPAKHLQAALFCALAGIILYCNTGMHGYVLDDKYVIINNQYVHEGLKGIPKLMNMEMWHFYLGKINLGYYRPLSMITFAIENSIAPGNPHISHLGNVLLYGMTGFFVYLLLAGIFRNFHPAYPFLTTMLFLAHPLHTEVIANIKSRDEILAFLNMVIALWLMQKANVGKKSIILTLLPLLFFYLALLSKETASSMLLLAPMLLFYRGEGKILQVLKKTIPLLGVFFVFEIQKYFVLGTVSGEVPHDIVNYPYAENGSRLAAASVIFLRCICLIVFPWNLSYDYSFNQVPAVTWSSFPAAAGIFIASGFLWMGVKGFLRKSVPWTGILFFLAALAPAIAFVIFRGGIMAERFLYAPTLGFCITLVFTALHFVPVNISGPTGSLLSVLKKHKLFPLFVILFSLYSLKTISRNRVWKSNLDLFSEDVNSSPLSCQVHRHYGSELIDLGTMEKDEAKKKYYFKKGTEELHEALRIHPHFPDVFFKLAVAYHGVQLNYDSAIYYYKLTIAEAPEYPVSYNNLGSVYENLGKQELASYYYNKAVEVSPSYAAGKKNQLAHHKKTGLDVHRLPPGESSDPAIQNLSPFIPQGHPAASLPPGTGGKISINDPRVPPSLRKTLETRMQDKSFYETGTDYASKGDYRNGIKYLEMAIRQDPHNENAYINLGNCYGILKEYDKAIEVLNKVLAMNPSNTLALNNLATTYEFRGDKKRALEYRLKARKIQGQ